MDTTNLRQVEGGTIIKQADSSSVLSFILQDAKGREVKLDGQSAEVALYTNHGKFWETSTKVKGAEVSFSLPGNLAVDDYLLDISVAGYVFPSDRDLIIRVTQGFKNLPDKETAEGYKKTIEEITADVQKQSNASLANNIKAITGKKNEFTTYVDNKSVESLNQIKKQEASAIKNIDDKSKDISNSILENFKDGLSENLDNYHSKDKTYTHIAYANSSDGAKDFTKSNSNRDYIGIYSITGKLVQGDGENLLKVYSHHGNVGYNDKSTTSAIAPIKKGETYTISYTVTNTNRFGFYQDTLSNGFFANRINTEDKNYKVTKIGDKIVETFTANIDGYVIIYLSNKDNNAREPSLKIEKGSQATVYSIPVEWALKGPINPEEYTWAPYNLLVQNKVDKEVGKGLSDNNFSNSYKSKLDNLDKDIDKRLEPKADKTKVDEEVQKLKDLIYDSETKYQDDMIYILDPYIEAGEVKFRPKEIGKLLENDFLKVPVNADKMRFKVNSSSQGIILLYSLADKDLQYAIHVYPNIKDYEIDFGKTVNEELIFTSVTMPEDKVSVIREEGFSGN